MSSVTSRIYSLSLKTPSNLEAWVRALAPWAVTLLALAARLYGVEANGLWSDETHSLWMASRTLPDLFNAVVIEGHDASPPTFNLMLHFVWMVSQEIWALRMISVVAGAALVWFVFQLANSIFDYKVALLSAFLLAISPFSIEYAQIARTHALTGLLSFTSIYYFSRLLRGETSRKIIWLYGVSTWAALSTHYLAGLVLVFENTVVLVLLATRRISTGQLRNWLKLQLLIGLAALPIIYLALPKISMLDPGRGQSWLAAPSVTGIARTLILWGTGDPSIGPARFTIARLASLVLLLTILCLGVFAMWKRWTERRGDRRELLWVGFIAAAFLVPLSLAQGVSLFRRIFNEKYFLALIPFLLILLAWSVLRIRPVALGRGIMLALIGLTMLSLTIYYTFPPGEQWREAIAYLRQERHNSEYVAVIPGFYMRPVSYYLTGSLPPHDYRLLHSPIAIFGPAGFIAAEPASESSGLTQVEEAFELAGQVWLVTGYAEVDPVRLAWFEQNYIETDRIEFQGVQVVRGERK